MKIVKESLIKTKRESEKNKMANYRGNHRCAGGAEMEVCFQLNRALTFKLFGHQQH